MAVFSVGGFNCTIYGKLIEDFRARCLMVNDEYTKTFQEAVDIMSQMNNTINNMARNNKHDNRNQIYKQENYNTRNDIIFSQTS